MTNNSVISDEIIERLKRQEEKLLSAYKEVINQWRGSLLIFAGLAMAALGNQHDAFAYSLIVLWLIEALFILSIFWLNHNVYNLMMDRHFEGTVSEEQEQRDIKYAEKKNKQTKICERLAFSIFLVSTILTMIYFIISAFYKFVCA
ncbi:MAG: hypothetical protein AAB700_01545 [Patescibacteria group bacterium]